MTRPARRYARQGAAKVHVARSRTPDVAVCGAELHGDEFPARMVPQEDRCQAAPCRVQWPAFLRSVG